MSDLIALAQSAADQLQGTCKSVADLGQEFEAAENKSAFCAELDQLVFCCDVCNWWFEMSDMAQGDEWICEACAE